MALKLTPEQKEYDNFLRQINTQLVKAHSNLGENSQQYKNLIILGSSVGLSVHQNKNGVYQYDRNRKQIDSMNNNQLQAMKDNYYHHDKSGNIMKDKMKKGVIERQYNVQNKINQVKKDAKKYFNTKAPTKKQMVYMAEKDMLVSEFWYQYAEHSDNATDDDDEPETIRYHAYQDIANDIYAGYDIDNKPKTLEDFDRLHNLVTDALARDNNRLVVNINGNKVDAITGEVLGEISDRTNSLFMDADSDYFEGDDWTEILL